MERISSLHSYVIERPSLSAVDLVEDDETDGAFLRLDTFTLFSKRLSSFLRKGAPSRAIKTIDLPQSFLYQAHLKQHCLLWCPSHFCTHWRPRSLDSSSSISQAGRCGSGASRFLPQFFRLLYGSRDVLAQSSSWETGTTEIFSIFLVSAVATRRFL